MSKMPDQVTQGAPAATNTSTPSTAQSPPAPAVSAPYVANPADDDFDFESPGAAATAASPPAPAGGPPVPPQNAALGPDGKPLPPTAPDPVAELQARLQRSERRAELALAAMANGTKPPPADPNAKVVQKEPTFNFSPSGLPPALLTMYNSEDSNERLQALMMMMSGVANAIHSRFQSDVEKEYQPQFMARVQEYYQTQAGQKDMGQQFYSKYPHLNNRDGQLLAQTAAVLVAQEFATAGKSAAWTPEFMEALANKVHTLAPALKPSDDPAAAAAAAAALAAAGRRPGDQMQPGGRARPNTPGATSLIDHMAEIALG